MEDGAAFLQIKVLEMQRQGYKLKKLDLPPNSPNLNL